MSSISVVTPACIRTEDERKWLVEAIESVRRQTVPCEHVVWDDASEIDISGVKSAYPDIVWRGWSGRRGVCWTRNAAVSTAKGPLILPLDANDLLVPQAAEYFKAAWEGEGPHCFTYSDVRLFGFGVEMDRTLPNYDFGLTLRTCLAPVTILYPKVAWIETGGYDPQFETGMEDWAFLIALGVKGYCGVHIPQPLLWYRSHPNSRRQQMRGQTAQIIAKIREKFAAVYAGELPEGCCAGTGEVRIPSVKSDRRQGVPPPPESPKPGKIVLRYTGSKRGTHQIFLRPTKRFISVSTGRPMVSLTEAEADWLLGRHREFVRQ